MKLKLERTAAESLPVIPRSEATWESVIPLRKSREERIATASVRTGLAMTGIFTWGAAQSRFRVVREAGPYGTFIDRIS